MSWYLKNENVDTKFIAQGAFLEKRSSDKLKIKRFENQIFFLAI